MKVDFFVDRKSVPTYFILDSHEEGNSGQNGTVFDDEDFVQYSYAPKRNNKLVPNSAFLYRIPGDDFCFTGGGCISKITGPNDEGFKTAFITHGFTFIEPIKKGDPFLENFQWKKKHKPGPGWRSFFTNYGMLRIEEEDFWGLVYDLECKPGIPKSDLTSDRVVDIEMLIDVASDETSSLSTKIINNSPISRPNPITVQGKVYPRNRTVARNALGNANYMCECDNSHPLFLRRGTKINYCEPHHLVPMGYQEGYENVSLDREENIVSLCSNCHNQIHYGEGAKEIVTDLYNKRKDALKRVGIEINIETLLSMYGLS